MNNELEAIEIRTEAESIAALAVPDVATWSAAEWLGLPDGYTEGEYESALRRGVLVSVSRDNHGEPFVKADDFERFAMSPRRASGNTEVHTLESFLDVSLRHYLPGVSTVYVEPLNHKVQAVFNDHSEAAAGWRDHTATYKPQRSLAHAAWAQIDRTSLTQVQLAEFLSDWQHTIAEPDGADVYEIAQAFEATIDATFTQGARLSTGARQLVYTEDVAAKSGDLQIPERLTLSFRLYEDEHSPVMSITAALRYTIRDGSLTFKIVLEPLADKIADYFASVAQALRTNEGYTIDVVYGRPS